MIFFSDFLFLNMILFLKFLVYLKKETPQNIVSLDYAANMWNRHLRKLDNYPSLHVG